LTLEKENYWNSLTEPQILSGMGPKINRILKGDNHGQFSTDQTFGEMFD